WNSSANQPFTRPFGINDSPVGEHALLTPGTPIFRRRGLPVSRQLRHTSRLFCHNSYFLGPGIYLNEQRLPTVCFCVPKRLKSGVTVAQKNRRARCLRSDVSSLRRGSSGQGSQSIHDFALEPAVARNYLWPSAETTHA